MFVYQNDQQRQDITEYKLQLQSQRNMMVSRNDDTDMASKLKRKNKDLAEAMEELQVGKRSYLSMGTFYSAQNIWIIILLIRRYDEKNRKMHYTQMLWYPPVLHWKPIVKMEGLVELVCLLLFSQIKWQTI